MHKDNLHTIERFALDAGYYEVESAKKAQSQITALASSKLAEVFERVCSKYGADVYYKIRRVKLDLGDIPEDILETELIKRFENKLTSILGSIRRGEIVLDGVEGFELKTLDENIIEGLVYFLNHGVLPYHIQKMIGNRSVKDLLLELNETKIPVFRKELRNSVTSLMAKRRIVRLFPGNELLQFFHFMIPGEKGNRISQIFTDLVTVIKKINHYDVSNSLEVYCQEYFVNLVLQDSSDVIVIDEKLIRISFLKQLESEKQIIPEKWVPELVNSFFSKTDRSTKSFNIFSEIVDYYIDYLVDNKSVVSALGAEDLLQKQHRKMESKEITQHIDQQRVIKEANVFLKRLVSEVKGLYKAVDADRIEMVISSFSNEILPIANVTVDNVAYWSDALKNEIKRIFGIAIPFSCSINDDRNEVFVSDDSNSPEEKQKVEFVSNSVTVAYWMMFLSAGVTPFKKLYVDPATKLKSIFSDFINNDPEAAAWQIKERINQQNVMIVGWWIKESLGDDLFAFYKSQLPYSLSNFIENDISYPFVITSFFFGSGNFPWPELNQKGQVELIQQVNRFAEDLDEYTLQQLTKDNGLFQNATAMKKVFSLVSIPLAKKLTQVRRNFLDSGEISEKSIKDFTDNRAKRFSESSNSYSDSYDVSLNEEQDSIQTANVQNQNKKQLNDIDVSEDQKRQLNQKKDDSHATELDNLDKQETLSAEINSSIDEGIEEGNINEKGPDTDIEVNSDDVQHHNLESDTFDFDQFLIYEKQRCELLPINELLDEIAYDIMHFKGRSSISLENQKDRVFTKINIAVSKSYYHTAAMLVGIPQQKVNEFITQLTSKELESIKKLIKNYRARFVSMAEDIRKSEEDLQQQNSVPFDENQSLSIQNAGLVLLNPYLLRLFKRFELISGKEFVDDIAKEKGVFLLQYIANKSSEPEEWELPLNKILCGIPLGVPIKTEIKLTDEEKQICDGLLEAMVKNWGALKNTSEDGLRTSFLMREGTIRKEATGWKLHIEKKVYDILLEKLPWGYSMIQLPWMEMPLHTEWETK